MGASKRAHGKAFISGTEYRESFGGYKGAVQSVLQFLPFNCCSLSFQPISDDNAVCTDEGHVFDRVNIIPWIAKFGNSPVTGKPLQSKDLFRINFHKNAEGKYTCPVSSKDFTNHTHIVAIKPSGNVYSWDTVNEMNIKMGNWNDLLTGEKFTRTDIISIQDPHNLTNRNIKQFYFVEKEIEVPGPSQPPDEAQDIIRQQISSKQHPPASASSSSQTQPKKSTTPSSFDEQKQPQQTQPPQKKYLYTNAGSVTGMPSKSASFTSTSMNIMTRDERNETEDLIKREELYQRVKKQQKKGYIRLHTNVGDLNLELHCDMVPQTCENFTALCETNFYDGVKFHRLIPGFMIQGGDPSSTGRGGQSVWGKPFADEIHPKLKHSERGILSMANSGKNTNGSQFFIAFAACPHLDGKHSVFGRVVGGMETLDSMERTKIDKNDRPKTDILIQSAEIFVNPFKEDIQSVASGKDKQAQPVEEPIKFSHYGEDLPVTVLERVNKQHQQRQAAVATTASSSVVGRYLNIPQQQQRQSELKKRLSPSEAQNSHTSSKRQRAV